MRLGEGAISNLAEIAYGTGMLSSSLIAFFNSFALTHPVVRMLESKRRFADQAWRELNGRPEMQEAINQILHPHYWPDADERDRRIEADCRRISNGEQYLTAAELALRHPMSCQWKGYWQRRRIAA